MKLIKHPFFILFFISLIFFWQVFTKGLLPFPADLLLSEYNPWRHTSYFGYVEGSIPNKAQYFDVIRELYPWKTLVIDQLKKGQVPLWNPYNFSGSPLMANFQSQVWYPLGALYLILPQPVAWTILIILQPLLGSLFMYLFARIIGLSKTASILSAIVFNYSSFSTVWLEFNTVWHTILWIPLILYLVELRIQKPLNTSQKLLFVFSLFSSMTAGHPQDFINSFLFVSLYAVTRTWFLQKRILIELGILTLFAFLLGAVQILPTIELFIRSARVPHDVVYVVKTMLIQLWQFPIIMISDFFGNPATRTYVLPDTYVNKTLSIGVIGFMLAIHSLWTKKTFHTKFFIISSATLLLLTTNNPISQLFYRFPIPLLSTGTPTRQLFLYIFSVSLLAGYGFDHLKYRTSYKKTLLVVGGIFTIIFIAYLVKPSLLYDFGTITISAMKKSLLLAISLSVLGIFFVYASKKIPKLQTALLVLALAELLYGFTKFNSFIPQKYIFPENELFTYLQAHAGIHRFWGYGTAHIEANFATQYHLYSPDGTDPLNLSWYNKFIQSSDDGNFPQIFTRTTRSDAYIKSGYGISDLPQNIYRLRILDTLGVRYIIDRSENPKDAGTFPANRFVERWHKESWTVYENLLAAPRYFLTTKVKLYKTDKEFEQLFFNPAFDPASEILIESNAKAPTELKESLQNTVNLVSYTPNEIIFHVKTDNPQYLFLSDTYDSGWNSYIDTKPTTTFRANYALRAILVPAGDHIVKMTYAPKSFLWGLVLSLTGILLLIILILQRKSK